MKHSITFFCALLLLIMMPKPASAQYPRTLSYQSVLTDSLGNPKPDGNYAFKFYIYNVASGGSSLWNETKTLGVKRGLFITSLGDVTPFPASLSFRSQLWLGVAVSDQPELAPRVALLSVPSSLWSQSADSAGTIADSAITSEKIKDGSIQLKDIGQNAAASGQVIKWNGSSWAARNDSTATGGSSQWTTNGSDIYYNSGKVGIGVTPAILDGVLDVAGRMRIRSGGSLATSAGSWLNNVNNTALSAFVGMENDSSVGFYGYGGAGWDFGMNTRTGDIKIAGDATISKTDGPRLILKDNWIGAERPRISFGGDPLAIFDGDTSMGHTFSFMNTFSVTRNYDANVRIHGKAAASWGTYLDLTHDGTNGIISTDVGNIVLSPATGNVGIGTSNPAQKLDVSGGITISGNLYLPAATNTTGIIYRGNTPLIHSSGSNSFFCGEYAGNSLTSGDGNTAIGDSSLRRSTSGGYNTASGYMALYSKTDGISNTAMGSYALWNNTTGGANTACGVEALWSNTTGMYNTAIGWEANVTAGDLGNATAIGYLARVDASNKIRLGNTAVTVIEGQVAYTFTSDSTKKENHQSIDGEETLRKIKEMKVGSWNYKGHDPAKFRHYGPMAQEFFSAFGHDDFGTIGTDTTINSGDLAGVSLIAINALEKRTEDLVNLVKDQQRTIERLQVELNAQKSKNTLSKQEGK